MDMLEIDVSRHDTVSNVVAIHLNMLHAHMEHQRLRYLDVTKVNCNGVYQIINWDATIFIVLIELLDK